MTWALCLAFDTATEVTAVGLAWRTTSALRPFAAAEVDARRAAMSRLLPMAESVLSANAVSIRDVSAIVVGRGPGSFTGVRIGVATAKGLAHGLGVPLYGVGTLEAIAWRVAAAGREGLLGVVGDAMRGEVYPALFRLEGGRAKRLTADTVAKPDAVVAEWAGLDEGLLLAGNGLRKYGARFGEGLGERAVVTEPELWAPSGEGLFSAFAQALKAGEEGSGDPGEVLPVYTRLSDAEENELARKGLPHPGTPGNGVAGAGECGCR
ncbi:MAG: tRNA (adenosine(37)-N6)-threonylcarbamoyltransferase complex dimerization subunit type 1 TsaB [Coriobacteriia bacterium]